MKCQSLLCLLVFHLSLSATACSSNDYEYCAGINETNMPNRIVLIENMRTAIRYQLTASDKRLIGTSLLGMEGEYTLLNRLPYCCSNELDSNLSFNDSRCVAVDEGACHPNDEEGLTMGYPSCAGLDGFGVGELHIRDVKRHMVSIGIGMSCDLLDVSATSDDGHVSLNQLRAYLGLMGFSHIVSRIDEMPSLNGGRANAWSYVSVSPVYTTYAFGYLATESPIDEASLYAQDTADGSPPLMISRIWHFSDAPENAVFREYLGIEEEGAFTCGDLYFGYFAR